MARVPKVDRQREHQANERTFLAWLRTSITLIGFGFAIARFGLFLRQFQSTLAPQEVSPQPLPSSDMLGIGLVVVGIGVILLAAYHYNQVFWQIERGHYRPNRRMVWMITTVVVMLGSLSIPLVLLRSQGVGSPRPARPSQPQSPRSSLRH